MVAVGWALGALCLCALGEKLHARRLARVSRLAFGPSGRPRGWTRAAPVLRGLGCALLAWGLVTLLNLSPDGPALRTGSPPQHLVFALDVSPSMQLGDAGPSGRETRAQRARALLASVAQRTNWDRVRVSVVAFWTGARPVCIDTQDPEVLHNILAGLPMEYAFEPGKTDMYQVVTACGELAGHWPKGSASLVLVGDGDSVPESAPLGLPAAFAHALVVGVGDPRGQNVDGHLSRHDAEALSNLARRLGGTYFDGNLKHVPSASLAHLLSAAAERESMPDERLWARAAVLMGAALLAFLPPMLILAGTSWRGRSLAPGRAAHA